MLDLNEIEILQVALSHEGRAREFYDRMAARHGDSTAGDLFRYLSAEEEGHIRKLTARYRYPAFEAAQPEKHLPYLIDLDRMAREDGVDADVDTGPEAVRRGLGIARKAELHAVEFYSLAGGVVDDKATKTLLAELEDEERRHLARIEGHLANLPPGPR
ncbi:MAG: ferritin family protein [Deltaproteobacteria bacterium]|nr:ferritin family protein [Deltaproteobacteria bacterium]